MNAPTKIIVPLVSAFTDDLAALSEIRIARIVKFHKEHGAAGFMVNAGTADCFLMPAQERKQTLEWVIRESHGLPVWVHATSLSTSGTVDLCQHAARHGARGIIVTPPPVGSLFLPEVKAFLSSVARHGNIQGYWADPSGAWAEYANEAALPMNQASSVGADSAILPLPSPDECVVEDGTVTPLAMFGADQIERMTVRAELFRPAMESLLRHSGLARSARAAMIAMGVEVGPSRGPVLELADEGKEILTGIMGALSLK